MVELFRKSMFIFLLASLLFLGTDGLAQTVPAPLQIKDYSIKTGKIQITTPVIEGSGGGTTVDVRVNRDLSHNSLLAVTSVLPLGVTIQERDKFDKTYQGDALKGDEDFLTAMAKYVQKNWHPVMKGSSKPGILHGYLVKTSRNDFLSLVQFTHVSGAKHRYFWNSVNYDLQKGRSVPLRDLFKFNSNYRERLAELITRQAQADALALHKLTGKSVAIVKNIHVYGNEEYYVDGGKTLVVVYNPGFQDKAGKIHVYAIPLASLQDILNLSLVE